MFNDMRYSASSNQSEDKRRFSASLDTLIRNLQDAGRGRKQAITMLLDTALVVISLLAAYSFRLGTLFTDFSSTGHLFISLPVLTVFVFSGLGVYRWVIRSSNQRLYNQLVKGCIVSSILLVIGLFLFPPERLNPWPLFVTYGLMLTCGTLISRLLWKGLFDTDSEGEPVAVHGVGSFVFAQCRALESCLTTVPEVIILGRVDQRYPGSADLVQCLLGFIRQTFVKRY